ncbi:MAG: 2-oxo acid dehydrogenase subunit E2 [Phycisphaeraceae bacterium]|nr:MAG: 2-oxo acid dehydrogenase subunit E2 [Phycisphaeraceae bacterium]
MSIDITMPRLSDTMEEGTVIKWNVKEGDSVSPGDVLADIETDKATMELQAYDEGTVAKILIGEGESVSVGSKIMVLAEEGEDADEAASSAGKASSGSKKKSAGSDDEDEDDDSGGGTATATKEKKDEKKKSRRGEDASSSSDDDEDDDSDSESRESSTDRSSRNGAQKRSGERGDGDRVFASPLAKKIAEEEGLDLGDIKGSGPSGRIVRKDVEAAIRGEAPSKRREKGESGDKKRESGGAPAPTMEVEGALEGRTVSLSNMRRTIAKRLVESKTRIPHYQVTVTAKMDPLMELRKQLNSQLEKQNVKLSVNDFLVRACALAMHKHHFVNSKWIDKGDSVEIEILENVNVGVAIAIPIERGGGLVVATLRDADRMGLRQISAETRRLAEKARTKGLTVEEMDGSTFTISNLGMYGVDHFSAIINPPNAAILAVGGAIEKPVVRDGAVVVGHEMSMTMSSDHRVIDGAMAAEYLVTLRDLLENPATLLV